MPHAAPESWSLERLPPVPAALLFAAKTFLAAMLALYIAFLTGLDRPAWAMTTVYIVSQPISGAVLAKGVYRTIGTLVGGLFTLFAVPALVNAPVLLTLALSLWVGGCLFLSLRDRTPRSYAFMLAGYSAAIIGFPNVMNPAGLFDVVTARVQEISLGIICATLVAALILPQTAHAAARARLRQWLRSCDTHAAGLLDGSLGRADMARGERALASEITGLRAFMVYLSYEPAASRELRTSMRGLYDRTVLQLRFLAEIRDRLLVARADGPLDPALDAALKRLAAWAALHIDSDPVEGAAAIEEVARIAEAEAMSGDWRGATLLNLAARLKQFVDVREDCRTYWQALQEDHAPAPGSLRVPVAAPPALLAAIDIANARGAAMAVILALWITCAFWILTAWPDGATAAMMAAIAGCLSAAQREPNPAMTQFGVSTVLAMVPVFIYQFGILPAVVDFPSLILVLAPALLLFGTMMALPGWAMFGMGLTATFSTLLALQNTYTTSVVAFAGGNIATVVGVGIAVVMVNLLRPRSAEQAAAHLLRHGWADVAALAALPGGHGRLDLGRRMLDRLGLLAPTAPQRGDDGEIAFATVFAAEGVLGLADLEAHVSATSRPDYDRLLALTARHYGDMAARRPADGRELIEAIEMIHADMAASPGAIARRGLVALVSLRRGVLLGQEGMNAASGAA